MLTVVVPRRFEEYVTRRDQQLIHEPALQASRFVYKFHKKNETYKRSCWVEPSEVQIIFLREPRMTVARDPLHIRRLSYCRKCQCMDLKVTTWWKILRMKTPIQSSLYPKGFHRLGPRTSRSISSAKVLQSSTGGDLTGGALNLAYC